MPRWLEQEERDTEGFGGDGKTVLNTHWALRRQAFPMGLTNKYPPPWTPCPKGYLQALTLYHGNNPVSRVLNTAQQWEGHRPQIRQTSGQTPALLRTHCVTLSEPCITLSLSFFLC